MLPACGGHIIVIVLLWMDKVRSSVICTLTEVPDFHESSVDGVFAPVAIM